MKEVIDLELRLLEPKIRQNREELNHLLDPEFIEIGSRGIVMKRDEIIEALLSQKVQPTFIPSDIQARKVTEDVVLVTFEIHKTDTQGLSSRSMRSSLWRKNSSGAWQMFFHQGTPIAT